MEKVLLIDAQNLAWRAFHKFIGLKHKGQNTSLIFGFVYILHADIVRFKPEKVFIVWDGKKNKHRLDLHPLYKAMRKLNPNFDDFLEQKKILMRLLKYMGLTQVHNIEMEADDYIYMLTRKYQKTYEIVIASSDKDFKQLIRKNVTVWDGSKKTLFNSNNCEKLYGYKPSQVVDYLAIRGDDSDNIPGYRGMGEVKTAQFFEKYGSIKNYLESGETFLTLNNDYFKEVINKNYLMVDLRLFYKTYLKGNMKITYLYKTLPFNEEKYLKLCRKYAFKHFIYPQFIKVYASKTY